MKYLYQNKHWEPNKEYNLDKLLYLMIDRPNEINYNNNEFVWINNKNQRHRNYDLPSYVEISNNNLFCWYIKDKKHRERSKPAIVSFDGVREYYINDKFLKRERL